MVADACRSFGVPAECIQGDFSSQEDTELFVRQCLDRFPLIGNLINNVGNYAIESALDTSAKEWENLFQVNLHAPIALSKAFLPTICQHRGNIINIGVAGVGNMTANTYCTAYQTTKMALWMVTKSLAKELAPQFVRVNMVSPGYLENSIDLPADLTKLPMQRPASLEEVARVVAFLLHEQSSYITGQNIEVGGGVRL